MVAKILRSAGFGLQGTRKTLDGAQHPDRDAQFRYINSRATQFLAAGEPVISVDTKKRSLRHEAPYHIPSTAGRNSEEHSWA